MLSSCRVGGNMVRHLSARVPEWRCVGWWFRSGWNYVLKGRSPRAVANSWAKIKAINTEAGSQGSISRAVSIYYSTDKRIPRRCFQLRNNSYTLGMNKLQSQVRGVRWLRVLLSLCLQLRKREGEFSGFLLRQKKLRGKTKLKTGPDLGQNKFKCESFNGKTKTL